jgi:hypothetical protein
MPRATAWTTRLPTQTILFYVLTRAQRNARTLQPAALAFVPYGFVLVRVRVRTTIKYLHGAADNDLGTTFKYLRFTTGGAAGSDLGTTIKYLRHTMKQKPGQPDQVLAAHNERRR